ncbi:hypothetical protein KJ644_01675 [Candidatus Dependentiae bacterium]|nr:hypothetical protein [Candidatus Dependentiae bacterium]MBU4387161.1 hypothetical protein [Candidatus Dependentiae bacterium]MCG2756746.1 hypothetical protein [Candidatus Dependentiae bacterium]
MFFRKRYLYIYFVFSLFAKNILGQGTFDLVDNNNLGDIAYQNKDYGRAMLYWKRAELELGIFDKLPVLKKIDNLKQELFIQKQSNKLQLFKDLRLIRDYFVLVVRTVPHINIKIIFLLIWIIAFLSIQRLFRRKRKLLIFILFFGLAFSGLTLVLRYKLDFSNYGVVVLDDTKIYSGAGSDYSLIAIIPQATVVRVEDNVGDFYRIKNQRTVGFVDQKCVEKIVQN